MRAMACVCLMAACLGLVGCKTFGRRSKERGDAPAQQADPNWPGPLKERGAAETNAESSKGILAGRVLDSFDHCPPPTTIKVELEGNKGAPIEKEVEVDTQGYFTIPGLQNGQHYHLTARTRQGERKMAGQAWAIPPNARLLIYMSQDFATENTPPAPGAPMIPGQKDRGKNSRRSGEGAEQSSSANEQQTPNAIPPQQRTADIGRPIKVGEPSSLPSPGEKHTEARPEDIAADSQRFAVGPPVTNIPGRGDTRASLVPPPPNGRVPSCVLTGRQLDNFALYDLNAQPWEYRDRRGRIMLIDFWATWCLPCRQAIPTLKILQDRYGRHGLEIVGIAYEEGPLPEQIRKVQRVRDNLAVNYRLLLGSDIKTCPVKTQFQVVNFPTLVLIDEKSRIIWRCEGLDTYQIRELETLIQRQLQVHY